MGREELKAALRNAGIHPDELAELVDVDVKTVQRWLSATQSPRSRHRLKIARALGLTETDLWPELATDEPDPPADAASAGGTASATPESETGPGTDLIAAYTDVGQPDAPKPYSALIDAREQVDVLQRIPGITGWRQLIEIIGLTTELACPTRLLIQHPTELRWAEIDPDPDRVERDEIITRLTQAPHVKLGHTRQTNYETIVRADQQIFATIALGTTQSNRCPYLHITQQVDDGMFDRFTTHIDQLWEHAQPVPLSNGQPPPPRDTPRRWPGRPS